MTLSFAIGVIIGAFIGVGMSAIPLIRQYRRDQRILRLLRRGSITVNEAREMRKTSAN